MIPNKAVVTTSSAEHISLRPAKTPPSSEVLPAPVVESQGEHGKYRRRVGRPLFEPAIVRKAVVDSVRKHDPRHPVRTPVMLVVEVGSDCGRATTYSSR